MRRFKVKSIKLGKPSPTANTPLVLVVEAPKNPLLDAELCINIGKCNFFIGDGSSIEIIMTDHQLHLCLQFDNDEIYTETFRMLKLYTG